MALAKKGPQHDSASNPQCAKEADEKETNEIIGPSPNALFPLNGLKWPDWIECHRTAMRTSPGTATGCVPVSISGLIRHESNDWDDA